MNASRRFVGAGGNRRYTRASPSGSGASAPPTFDSIFSGAVDYWDPAIGVSTSSSKVTNWIGQITGANDLAQPTDIIRPVLVADGLNGLPEIDFPSSDYLEDATLSTGIASGERMTLIWVGKIATALSGFRHIALIGKASLATYMNPHTNSSTLFKTDQIGMSDGNETLTHATALDTNSHYFHVVNDPGGHIMSIDGVETQGAKGGTLNNDVDRLVWGWTSGRATQTVSFIGIVEGVPSAGELSAWATNVNNTWGL